MKLSIQFFAQKKQENTAECKKDCAGIPAYWKTRLDEVEQALDLVKLGKVSTPRVSAGGRPIYVVEYGQSTLHDRLSNCSSALGAGKIEAYADKTSRDYLPTVFLCGCIHGGEFEGTAAILNLIKLIETGTDYREQRNDKLFALTKKVHLILVPIVNPDGRSHIPFDSFVGRTFDELRYYNQGTWKDGSLCGWPECKAVHPIKDHVDYLGGYFNDDGINMMHEDFFSNNISTGTKLVFDICREYAPDFSILLHGGDNVQNQILFPPYSSGKTKKQIQLLVDRVNRRSDEEGLLFMHTSPQNDEDNAIPASFNLISSMHHCCSEPAVTYESNQGLFERFIPYTYDEIYRSHTILFEETIINCLNRYNIAIS